MEETPHSQAKRWPQGLEEQEKGPQGPPSPVLELHLHRGQESFLVAQSFQTLDSGPHCLLKTSRMSFFQHIPSGLAVTVRGPPHPTSGVQVWGAPGDPPQLSPPTGSQ